MEEKIPSLLHDLMAPRNDSASLISTTRLLYLGLRKKGEKLAGGAGHKREFSYICGGTDRVSRAQ